LATHVEVAKEREKKKNSEDIFSIEFDRKYLLVVCPFN
jgi:hypothetical protein